MKKNKKEKVCFLASSGGHLEEISRLVEIEEKYDNFLVTEKGSFDELHFAKKVFHVYQVNRKEILFFFKFIGLIFAAFWILLKEKPTVLISTGALATVPFCMVGKLLGKRIVYIESFARVDTPSLTGKIMYKLKLANLFVVQWEDMLKYFPEATIGGKIF